MPLFANVYVVRHGETQENREGIIQGQLDTALNDTGVEQARLVANALRAVPFDFAYSSDLVRALKTAQIIVERQEGAVELQAQEELRERNMGNLQGIKGGKLPAFEDETVETWEALASRAASWWKRIILQRTRDLHGSNSSKSEYNILVTSHGAFIGALGRTLVGSSKLQCAPGVAITSSRNTSVTIIEVNLSSGRGTIVQFGDVAHLTPKLEQEIVETNVDERPA
ncbi:phosphoglycerate mutase-like protein [Mycena rebaudengoi]|nr:phosphoglycerate mutase-like protein [Mycena rebaudengoi]